MRRTGQIVLLSAARLYGPLVVLFALSLFVARSPGEGVGLLAGLALALALVLHMLVFGAAAARAAAPPLASRLVLVTGFVAAALGAGLPGLAWAPLLIEAGLFAATAGAAAIVISVFVGRAPSLRDEDW